EFEPDQAPGRGNGVASRGACAAQARVGQSARRRGEAMNAPVLISHVGAVTSMGLSAFETAFVYRAQGLGLSALVDPETGEALLVGGVPTLDPTLVGAERVVELGKLALDDLWADGA